VDDHARRAVRDGKEKASWKDTDRHELVMTIGEMPSSPQASRLRLGDPSIVLFRRIGARKYL
jgi:hypothetical protein